MVQMIRTISVIGGRGAMGRRFVDMFRAQGLTVRSFDSSDGEMDYAAAAAADVVVLAVPIRCFEEVVVKLGPHTRKDGLVADITSVKELPVKIMLNHCRGEVLGGHPLFGPAEKNLEGQIFFLCPARLGNLTTRFKSLLKRLKFRIIVLTAAEHDRQMSIVQSLRHMMMAGFGATIAKFGDAGQLVNVGDWFGRLKELRDRQAAQSAELFADIALNNPHSREVFDEFAAAVERLKNALDKNDRKEMIELMKSI